MSIRISARKVAFWSTMLMMAATAGGLWFAYTYVTDSDTLAAFIRAEAPRYLPGSRLVIGRVRPRLLVGDISLSHVALWQTIDGVDCSSLRIPWLNIRHDTAALLNGELRPQEVVVAQPELQVRRRKDGTWNLQGLLADPWPGSPLLKWPQVVIQNGTVHLSEGEERASPILRDLSVRIEPTAAGPLHFEASAKGDLFEHLALSGTIDRKSGRITLTGGELTRLVLSDTLRQRLPAEFHPMLDRFGIMSGEIDLKLKSLDYNPAATPSLHYALSAQLREGSLNCPRLPFPLTPISASVEVTDGKLTIDRAEGYYGKTTVRARPGGTVDLNEPDVGPLNVTVDVIDLEFNERLRAWTPPQFASLWADYRPQGRVSLALSALREERGGLVGFGMGVDCLDVAIQYALFPYPLDHIRGLLKWEGSRISLDLHTLIGGKPLAAHGTIDNPGPAALVKLEFQAEAMEIDKTLLGALPPDVRKVVDQFQPTGSVRGKAFVKRTPPAPGEPGEGRVTIDALLDLNERCSITWAGLPYRVANLKGQLELHPDSWVFKNMRGWNGQASITGSGSVQNIGHNQLKTDLHLRGEHLPFNEELRDALPLAWQKTWATLRPGGSSTVDARILVEPGHENYYLVIVPERETRIELRLPRIPGPNVPPGDTFDMPPMERVTGSFVFDNGTVTMTDVGFQFRSSPAHFAKGKVVVRDSGQFSLEVYDLEVEDFRIDTNLRKIMPPVMAQFARRLRDGETFRFRTNLGIGWSGQLGQPAWCSWNEALVVFNGNTIQTGLPLEHLQGQLDHLRGGYNGQHLEVHGMLALDSVSLMGQQLTQLSSPVDVIHNRATLSKIHGFLLGGEFTGQLAVDLDATPKYSAALSLRDADLQLYTKTLPGRQALRGLVGGQIVLNGLGNDLHTLQGNGDVHIIRGDLGDLPAYLLLVKALTLSPLTKTAFDSADATFRIQNGETVFSPIKLTGNAFSLRGSGTMSAQGELNLGLRVLYGRDESLHIPILSDAMREVSGQIFQIRVSGTPAYPKFSPAALQQVTNGVRSLGALRDGRAEKP
ncbi:MAG TPA: AsmA-like C-terminal region-containing protein [Isosphaeraceae bacterium]|jgi:hypothetical protein|nr:AsmA-like C-terminal region-containing protein [Isosphaeraceae bacterium]